MNQLSLRRVMLAVLLLLLFSSTSVLAAANVSVTPSGDSSYTLQGTGMNGVAGIQLDITYDTASLASPTVTKGGLVSGAMLAANTLTPGSIKIAIVSTSSFSASGQIATISFASKTGTGGITSANVSMIDSKGAVVLSSVSFANSSGSSVTDPSSIASLPFTQTTQTGQTVQTGTATTQPSYPGTVTLPADLQQRNDSQASPSSTPPVPSTEPFTAKIAEPAQPAARRAADAKQEETAQYVVYKGILERFKQYNGSNKLAAVTAIFDKEVSQTIHQNPAIVISNGQEKAVLTVDIPARISTSPNFAANSGKLVSFKQDKQIKDRWNVEVLPEVGSINLKLTIIAGVEEFEYPLTVAPALKTTLPIDNSGWNRFLKEVGTAKAPLHDLNNDGVRDYVDEYIFVANYLAHKEAAAKASKKK